MHTISRPLPLDLENHHPIIVTCGKHIQRWVSSEHPESVVIMPATSNFEHLRIFQGHMNVITHNYRMGFISD